MAGRLSRKKPYGALAVLVLPVLLLHLWLGRSVQELRQDWTELAPMPARMSVSYVREMPLTAAPQPKPVVKPRPANAGMPERRLAPAIEQEVRALPDEPVAAALPELPASAPELEPVPQALPPLLTADAEPGPEWPASTRLSYELTGNYRGAVTGQAQVEWIRQARRYQVHLDVSIGPGFAPLIARRMSSEGLLGPQGIAPQRYDEDTRVLFSAQRRVTLNFQGDQVQLGNGRMEPLPAGSQDAASQFVQLTWLFLTGRETLRVGHAVELPLVLPRRQYRWRYDILGEQELATPMGPLMAWHLKPSREAGGGDLTAEVWLAPGLQYLPVRIRIQQDAQTFIDLLLKAPPLQSEAR